MGGDHERPPTATPGVLSNSGTIDAVGGVAISGASFLILSTEQSIVGTSVASTSGTASLDLSTGNNGFNQFSVPGTITGIGSVFLGFQDVVVESGAIWSLTGTNHLTAAQSLSVEGNGTLTIAPGALTAAAGATLAFGDGSTYLLSSNDGSNTVLSLSDGAGGVSITGFDAVNTPNYYTGVGVFARTKSCCPTLPLAHRRR